MPEENRKLISVREVISDLLSAQIIFSDIYQDHIQNFDSPSLKFEKIKAYDEALLFQLKEESHQAFLNSKPEDSHKKSVPYKLNQTISTIFHKLRSLREEVYLLEVYLNPDESDTMEDDNQTMINEGKWILHLGMDRIDKLFKKSRDLLSKVLYDYRENGLIIRTLIENENIEKIYGQNGLEQLLMSIYKTKDKSDLDRPYHVAGQSYLESGRFNKAHHAFVKADRINPHLKSLRFYLPYTQGMDYYHKKQESEAETFLKEAKHHVSELEQNREKYYSEKIEEILKTIHKNRHKHHLNL